MRKTGVVEKARGEEGGREEGSGGRREGCDG